MLKTITNRSAKNLPLNMVKDAEVGSKTSSTTRSAKNLSAVVDMAEDTKVGKDDGGDNKMVERSPFSRKSSGLIGYLISLHSNANSAPFVKKLVSLNSFGYG